MEFYVYIHISPSKKRYVGVTTQRPEKRWDNGKGYKFNKHFFAAIQKYGWKNFKHQIFEVPSKDAMYKNERELIELFKTTDPEFGYNNSTGGEAGPIGCKHSLTKETRDKIAQSLKGRRRGPMTQNHKDKIGESCWKKIIGIDGVVYESVKKCRAALCINEYQFKKQIKEGTLKYA